MTLKLVQTNAEFSKLSKSCDTADESESKRNHREHIQRVRVPAGAFDDSLCIDESLREEFHFRWVNFSS